MNKFLTPSTVRGRRKVERERVSSQSENVRVSSKLIKRHQDVQAQTSVNVSSEEDRS